MMNAIYSSINLYAQLPIVAEIRPIQDSLRLSAGAVLAPFSTVRHNRSHLRVNYNGMATYMATVVL